jgi:soluble lytic murein transglycosylase-like protein
MDVLSGTVRAVNQHPPARAGSRKARPRHIIHLRCDGLTVFTVFASIVALEVLLWSGGWIFGNQGLAPMRLFVRDATRRAAEIAEQWAAPPPPPAPAAVLIARRAREVPPSTPIIHFAPVPPLFSSPNEFHPTSTPEIYADLIREMATKHDLPVSLVEAMVHVESDFDARGLSPKGARGLMQVIPATGRRFGVPNPDHLFYPAPNLAAGTKYMAWLLDRYQGDLDLALAAYNAGEAAVDRYGGIPPYRETQNYVKRVRASLRRLSARSEQATAYRLQ